MALKLYFFHKKYLTKFWGLPCSPLCDRETTQVSQSQIGFIDFIIIPTYSLLSSIFESVNEMLLREAESLLQRFREEDSTSHNSEETILAQVSFWKNSTRTRIFRGKKKTKKDL